MKNKDSLLKTFIIPVLFVSLGYGLLVSLFPKQIDIWNGLLICVSVSSFFYLWGEIEKYKEAINNFRYDLNNNAILFRSYPSWMREAARVISQHKNELLVVCVYKGYSHRLIHEIEYFHGTVKAIEEDKIERYYRIMAIRNKQDVDSVIDVLKVLLKSEKAKRQTRFLLSFDPSPNYISFLTVGENDVLIAFPDLSDGSQTITGHRCGLSISDPLVSRSLREIFSEIKRSPFTESLDFASLHDTEEFWQNFADEMLSKVKIARVE